MRGTVSEERAFPQATAFFGRLVDGGSKLIGATVVCWTSASGVVGGKRGGPGKRTRAQVMGRHVRRGMKPRQLTDSPCVHEVREQRLASPVHGVFAADPLPSDVRDTMPASLLLLRQTQVRQQAALVSTGRSSEREAEPQSR